MLWPFLHLLFTKWLPTRQTTENSNKWHCPGTHWFEGRPVACHPRARLTHGVTCQSFGGAWAQPWKRTNKNSEPVLAMAGAGPGNPTPAETSSLLQGQMARRFQGGPEGLTAHLAAGSRALLGGCHLVKFTPREGGHDCPYTNWGTMLPWEVSSLSQGQSGSWPSPCSVPWAPAEQDGPCCVDPAASRRPVAWTPAPARSHLRPQGLAAIFTPCSDTPAAKRISEMHSGRLHGLAETPGFHGSGPAGPSTKAGVFPGSAPRTPAIQTDSLSRSPWVWLSRTQNKRAFSICIYWREPKGWRWGTKGLAMKFPAGAPSSHAFLRTSESQLSVPQARLCVSEKPTLWAFQHTQCLAGSSQF